MAIYLHIVCGHFHTKIGVELHWQNYTDPQNLKYLLSGLLQTKFAAPGLHPSSRIHIFCGGSGELNGIPWDFAKVLNFVSWETTLKLMTAFLSLRSIQSPWLSTIII